MPDNELNLEISWPGRGGIDSLRLHPIKGKGPPEFDPATGFLFRQLPTEHQYFSHGSASKLNQRSETLLPAPVGPTRLELTADADGVDLALWILEFHKDGEVKSSSWRVNNGKLAIIWTPAPDTDGVRLALRIAGSGRLASARLTATAHRGRVRDTTSQPPNKLASLELGDSSNGPTVTDRVFDAYLGRIESPQLVTDTQVRLDWVIEQAEGPNVLDIGCSQGAAPILLAERRGFSVVGVDKDARAIATAEFELQNRVPEVQSLVRFICADFFEIDADALPLGTFDCVILGQILEHVPDPAKMLKNAKNFLKEGGKLIVTVPFGVWEHADHETTFYARTLWELLASTWLIEDMRIVGGRLAAIGRLSSGIGLSEFAAIELDYESFPSKERRLSHQLNSIRNSNSKNEAKILALQEEVRRLEATQSNSRLQADD